MLDANAFFGAAPLGVRLGMAPCVKSRTAVLYTVLPQLFRRKTLHFGCACVFVFVGVSVCVCVFVLVYVLVC